jgi:hypothetical protein
VLGGVDGNFNFPLPFMNSSLKPSLQHFVVLGVLRGFFISLYYFKMLCFKGKSGRLDQKADKE